MSDNGGGRLVGRARSPGARTGGDQRRRRRPRTGPRDQPSDGLASSLGRDRDGAGDQPDDPEAVARLICLRQLTAAPRTRAQLAETLRRRGVPEDAAEAVLGRFTEVGLIDDAMFASAWVESRHHGRGLGRRALAAELNQRGVDRDDIQAAVAKLSPETELATARALVERKLASTASLPAQVRLRRLVGMLARKGYPAGLAYRVVREALDQDRQNRAGDDLGAGDLDEDEFVNGEPGASESD